MTTQQQTRVEERERWKEHIQRAQRDPEGWAAYSRKSGIKVHTLYYWRKKLGGSALATKAIIARSSAFIPVQVIRPQGARLRGALPDPKWVAEVLLHLSADPSGQSDLGSSP